MKAALKLPCQPAGRGTRSRPGQRQPRDGTRHDNGSGSGASDLHHRHRCVLPGGRAQSGDPAPADMEHSRSGDGRPARRGRDARRLCLFPHRDQFRTRGAGPAAPLFFHRHRPQRQARRPDLRRPPLSRSAGPDAGLSDPPERDRGGQRRGPEFARGNDAPPRLRRADRRPRHHHRLGADPRRAVRSRKRARNRHCDCDARPRGREPRRRPDRRVPHSASRAIRPRNSRSGRRGPRRSGRPVRGRSQSHQPFAHAARAQRGYPGRVRIAGACRSNEGQAAPVRDLPAGRNLRHQHGSARLSGHPLADPNARSRAHFRSVAQRLPGHVAHEHAALDARRARTGPRRRSGGPDDRGGRLYSARRLSR